jgi:hypothetical protein
VHECPVGADQRSKEITKQRYNVAEAGVEHTADSSGKSAGDAQRAAYLRAFLAEIDPQLALIVAAWPNLSVIVRDDILTAVRQTQDAAGRGTAPQ